jgi:hypothetical protein
MRANAMVLVLRIRAILLGWQLPVFGVAVEAG